MDFEITRKWIRSNRTKQRGYTDAQLRCLGLKPPPLRGWVQKSIGKVITQDEKNRFEILGRQGKTLKRSRRTDRYSTVRNEKAY